MSLSQKYLRYYVQEIIFILQKISGLDVPGVKWKENKKRQPAPLMSFSRFDSENIKPNDSFKWNYSGKFDALTLTVNKAVLFHGVRLFGYTSGCQYKVKFTIGDDTVIGTYTSRDDDGVPGYDVVLLKPISLLPDKEITIIATIKGQNSYYGQGGKVKSSVKIDDIVVTFKDAPYGSSGNGTSKTGGQFYKFFLSEL